MTAERAERVPGGEVEQVQTRVGVTPGARLQWALDFAQRPLDNLTEGDWFNLRREVVAFGQVVVPTELAKGSRVAEWLERRVKRMSGSRLMVPLPSAEDVRAVQREFRRVVAGILANGTETIELGKIRYVVGRAEGARRPFIDVQSTGGAPGLQALAHLLAGPAGELLTICPEPKCGRWFVAKRPNQVYHSTTCQTRAAVRTFRAAKSDGKPKRRPGRPRRA